MAPAVGGDITDYSGIVNLNADVLFAFNSRNPLGQGQDRSGPSSPNDSRREGRPGRPLLITGHTDNIGGKAFNHRLSTQRADAVAAS